MIINDKLNKLSGILLAKAIKDLYSNVQLGDLKLNENGFVYTFITDPTISIKELPKITKMMSKNIDKAYTLKYETISINEAKKIFQEQHYKLDLLNDYKNEVGIIRFGDDYIDLCENLGIEKLSSIKSFELLNVSGIYWRGNSANAQLTGITGVAFPNKDELAIFKKELQERQERDHRKIGADQELFMFDNLAGQGLPIWLPKGNTIIHEIDNYVYELLFKNDYQVVNTPVLGNQKLYEISGHWSHYRENMFPTLDIDGDVEVLRPMTCPHHLIIYKQKPRSYRDLPYRIAEKAVLHRYESSGSLTGLERVRYMQLIDTHIVCTYDQIQEVVERCYKMTNEASNTLGIQVHSIDLALHDSKNTDKFFKNEKMWTAAESALRQVLNKMKIDYKEVIGEAAFYGPKIDMQVKTALGRIITAYTIQLDFLLPERFDLKYIDEGGQTQRPVFVHASVVGTLERLVSIMLEQNKGVFPVWLSPIQIALIPVDNQKHATYCKQINDTLKSSMVRVEYYNNDDRLSKKIRDAQMMKIPYQLVIGDNEVNHKTVSYRKYGEQDSKEIPLNYFVKMISEQIRNKSSK